MLGLHAPICPAAACARLFQLVGSVAVALRGWSWQASIESKQDRLPAQAPGRTASERGAPVPCQFQLSGRKLGDHSRHRAARNPTEANGPSAGASTYCPGGAGLAPESGGMAIGGVL
jgi:hypothetical protein